MCPVHMLTTREPRCLDVLQAQAHAASLHTPLDVVGVYFAPSDVASSQRAELHAIATKIAQTIASRLGVDAIALQVSSAGPFMVSRNAHPNIVMLSHQPQINNAKLASKTEHSLVAFRVGQGYSSSAKALPASAVQLADSGNALSRTRASVARGDWKRVVDFDGACMEQGHNMTARLGSSLSLPCPHCRPPRRHEPGLALCKRIGLRRPRLQNSRLTSIYLIEIL